MNLMDAIKEKDYLKVIEYLTENKQLNSWIDGKTIAHYMMEDAEYYTENNVSLYNGNIVNEKKESIIQTLTKVFKLDRKKAEENFYTLTQSSYYKYIDLIYEMISNGFDIDTKDSEGRVISDFFTELKTLENQKISKKKNNKKI